MTARKHIDRLFEMDPTEPDWPAYRGRKGGPHDERPDMELWKDKDAPPKVRVSPQHDDPKTKELEAKEWYDEMGEGLKPAVKPSEFRKLSKAQLHDMWSQNYRDWHRNRKDPLRQEELVKHNRKIEKRLHTLSNLS